VFGGEEQLFQIISYQW